MQLLRYLKKWMLLIIVFFVAMTVLSYRMLQSKQTYTASAVIEYKSMSNSESDSDQTEADSEGAEPASDGLAPDGTKIDVSEIYSSANMAKAMSNLGLSFNTYSLDALCASIKVEPIAPQPVSEQSQSQSDDQEGKSESEELPSRYIISCTLDSSASMGLVRDILNELLNVYYSDFSSKHINVEQVNNQTRDLADTDYDYLEMVERIDSNLTETLWALNARYQRATNFRSADTGYSFWDLRDQFYLIQNIELPKLYALVLGNQITKNRDLLINKYQNRVSDNRLTGEKAQEDLADALEVIDSYVEKMRQSGNTDIDYNYILNDVYDERWKTGNLVNRIGEYDKLLTNWIDYRDKLDHSVIDAAYCEYVIGVYRDGNTQLNTGGTDPQNTSADSAAPSVFAVHSSGQKATNEEAEAEIRAILDKMNGLYDIVTLTNVEYNEYLGAQAIRVLSSVSVGSSINMNLYMTVIAVFFLLIGCGGAILLGRAGDILEYLFLKDRLTGCMNRSSCDKYIEKWQGKPLPTGMCCVNIQITNQRDMNSVYGREQVDQAMKEFGRVLRELFENRKDGFVGYNGSGQFWVFFEKETQETVEQEMERLVLVLAHTLPDITLEYQLGAVNAGDAEEFYIRGLISRAVKERRPYTTKEASKDEGQRM